MADEQFGPYLLRERIGQGGMGEVFRADDVRRNRVVALKRLQRHLAADPEFRVRFARESAHAAKLREPHIIPIHDYGEIDGLLYIDMRLVEGVDLAAMLRRGPLAAARAVDVVSQIADALDAAHAEGLVHRDVKPSNVLLVGPPERAAGRGFAYLADFGIASTLGGSTLSRPGLAVGTAAYMAPERMTGDDWDSRADVYSLACMLYESLVGRRPFPAGDLLQALQAHLKMAPPRASAERPGLPPALDDVIITGMAKAPEDRYPSAGELAAAARDILDGDGGALPPPVPAARPEAQQQRTEVAAVLPVETEFAQTPPDQTPPDQPDQPDQPELPDLAGISASELDAVALGLVTSTSADVPWYRKAGPDPDDESRPMATVDSSAAPVAGADRGAGQDPAPGAGQVAGRGAGHNADQGADQGADRSAARSADGGADQSAGSGADQNASQSAGSGADRDASRRADQNAGSGADQRASRSTDRGAGSSADQNASRTADPRAVAGPSGPVLPAARTPSPAARRPASRTDAAGEETVESPAVPGGPAEPDLSRPSPGARREPAADPVGAGNRATADPVRPAAQGTSTGSPDPAAAARGPSASIDRPGAGGPRRIGSPGGAADDRWPVALDGPTREEQARRPGPVPQPRPGAARSDPALPDPALPDPARPDPARPDQSRPDQSRPDQSRPDQSRPDQGRPDQGRLEQASPDQGRPDQAPPHQGRLDQAPPDQAPPDQAPPDQGRPDQGRPGERPRPTPQARIDPPVQPPSWPLGPQPGQAHGPQPSQQPGPAHDPQPSQQPGPAHGPRRGQQPGQAHGPQPGTLPRQHAEPPVGATDLLRAVDAGPTQRISAAPTRRPAGGSRAGGSRAGGSRAKLIAAVVGFGLVIVALAIGLPRLLAGSPAFEKDDPTIVVGVEPAEVGISPDGTRAVVTNLRDSTVSIIDTATRQPVGLPVKVDAGPNTVAFTPDSALAYVSSTQAGTVSAIHLSTQAVVATIKVGAFPDGLVVGPDDRAYVANATDGTVSVIDTKRNRLDGPPITVGKEPYGLALSKDGGRLYAANFGDDTVTIIDTGARAVVATAPVGDSPLGVVVDADGSTVYVANQAGGTVSAIRTAENKVATTPKPVCAAPTGVALNGDGSRLYVACRDSDSLVELDTATMAVTATADSVGDGPVSVVVAPQGELYVVCQESADLVVLRRTGG